MSKKKINLEKIPNYLIKTTGKRGEGLKRVSFVEDPAIMVKAMMFSDESIDEFKFKEVDDEMLLAGPAMIPSVRIPRKKPDGSYYTVEFTPEVILELSDIFNEGNNNKSLNDSHQDVMVDSFIRGNWIVGDSTYDKSKFYGYDLPVGTWFLEVKVKDKNYWDNEVKKNGKNGFSIEGILSQELVRMESIVDQYIDNCEESSCECDGYESLIKSLTEEEVIELSTHLYLNELTEEELGKINQGEIWKKYGKR